MVERGGAEAPWFAGALVTTWLQSQNVPDSHRRELTGLASTLVDALLDTIEHSGPRAQASARAWAVNALRVVDRSNIAAMRMIVGRTGRWFSVVSRDVRSSKEIEE